MEKAIVFGCKLMGKIGVKVLRQTGKELICCCDNNPKLQGTQFEGLRVLSPEDAAKQYAEVEIYICLLNPVTRRNIKIQLEALGFKKIEESPALLWEYNVKLLDRGVDGDLYRKCQKTMDLKNGINIGNVSLVITEKCTLRCRECGVFIPYYKCPKHHMANEVIEAVNHFCSAVDSIENIAVIGGEPFLHPDLAKICEEISKNPQIINLSITTNGTVLPKRENLRRLKKVISYITISDYAELSKKKDELICLLKEEEIVFELLENDMEWYKQNSPILHHRGNENNDIFQNCFWPKAAGKIINGQYHLCDFSAGLTPFGVLGNNRDDYALLSGAQEEITKEVRALYQRKHCLSACDFCEIYQLPPTKRAEQTKGILEF